MEWFSPELVIPVINSVILAGVAVGVLYVKKQLQEQSADQREWIEKQEYATRVYVREQMETLAVKVENVALRREVQGLVSDQRKSDKFLDKQDGEQKA